VRYEIAIFLLLVLNSSAQNLVPFHYNYNIENGLPSNTVYSLLQTKNGAVYIGHDEGISRFNGRKFFHFTHKGKGKALNNLVETGNNDLLASSFYGDLALLKDNKLISHNYSRQEKDGRPVNIRCGSRIFIHERSRLFEYLNDTLIPVKFESDDEGLWILDLTTDREGKILVLYNKGGLKIKTLDSTLKIVHSTSYNEDIQYRVTFLKIADRIFIYCFDQNRLIEFDGHNLVEARNQLQYEHNYTKWLHAERYDNGSIIVFGFDGILFLDNNGVVIRHLLKGSQVSSVMLDREGNLWAGTLNEGVFVFPSLDIYQSSLSAHLDRNDYAHRVLKISDDRIIIGTFKGKLICIDTKNNIKKCLDFPRQSEVQSLMYDSLNKKIYAFCDGLFLIDENTFKIEKTWGITSTKDIKLCGAKIICATSNCLIIINGKNIDVKFSGSWINTIYCENGKKLWVGGNKGLFTYDLVNDREEKVHVPASGLNSPLIWRIHAVGDKMYVLIPGYGILVKNSDSDFHPLIQNELIRDFKINEGSIYAVFKKEMRIYERVTGKEIYRLNESKAMEPNIVDIIKTDENLVVIHPRSVKMFNRLLPANLSQPFIHLSGLNGSFTGDGVLTSGYQNNNIGFALEILGDIRAKKLSYLKYRFYREGDTQAWTEMNSEDEFTFNFRELAFGKYIFEALAVNEDGVESEPYSLNMLVLTPFWMKWWFIALEIFLLILLLVFIYRWRVGVLQKRADNFNERQLNEIKLLSAELTAIRSQMNPHFIFNTLSSIQAKVLSAKAEDAFDDISRFSQLIRSVLDFSSKEFIPLSNEIEFIKNYLHLESGRFDGEILYNLHIDEEIDVKYFEIPTLITIPFIENAIRHGLLHKDGEKVLDIRISGDNDQLIIVISDNGVGLEKSGEINSRSRKEHKSFALNSTQSRIDRINQSGKVKIHFELNNLNPGVEVLIKIIYC
jgi:ligand-binding sensor domain-containing protein/signal transduction histidine kinase